MIKSVLALLVAALTLSPVVAQEQAATTAAPQGGFEVKPSSNPEHGKRYGDWLKECEIIVEADKTEIEICQIVQMLSEPDSDRVVVKVAIGYVPTNEKPVMVISLPLGIFLPPGVQLRVDENEQVGRIPVNNCFPAGCQAGAELDSDFVERLQKGTMLLITFGAPSGQAVTAEVSLSGFTAGLKSLK